jgi:transposase
MSKSKGRRMGWMLRSGGVSNPVGAPRAVPWGGDSVPDPAVAARPKRRRFTADYKRSMVEQAEAGQEAGSIGALLRREGLYSSHLSTWRRPARQGELAAWTPQKRGRKITVSPRLEENRKLVAAPARSLCRRPNGRWCCRTCTRNAFGTRLRRRSSPRGWMRASIFVRGAACIASWPKAAKLGNAATNFVIRSSRSLSYSPALPIKSGAGI